MKILGDAVAEQNSDRTKGLQLQFAVWMMNACIKWNLSTSTKQAFNLWTKRTCGHARWGQRAVRVVAGQWGPNLTMTFAMSNQQVLVYRELIQGGMNGEMFNNYLERIRLCAGQNTCLLFDNAQAHGQARQANQVMLKWDPLHRIFHSWILWRTTSLFGKLLLKGS